MSAISIDVTIAATGVPQKVALTALPALPAITAAGITYSAGSATQTPSEIVFQANPANAANVTVRAGQGGGLILTPASAPLVVRPQGGVTLDDFSVIGTAADVVHVLIVG